MTAATATTVQYLNLAYFGRPADPASLTAFPATGMTDEEIVASFVKTNEYLTNTTTPNTVGGTLNQTALINTFYQRLFGRLAVSSEVNGWTTALAQGTVNEDYLGITIMRAGLNLPVDTEMRKVLVAKFDSAEAFTSNLAADSASAAAYSTSAAADSAASFLTGITTTTAATAAEAAAAVEAMVGTGNVGSTFTLTTSTEVLTGTDKNDTFSATQSTLSALDTLVGGAGTDTLAITTQVELPSQHLLQVSLALKLLMSQTRLVQLLAPRNQTLFPSRIWPSDKLRSLLVSPLLPEAAVQLRHKLLLPLLTLLALKLKVATPSPLLTP